MIDGITSSIKIDTDSSRPKLKHYFPSTVSTSDISIARAVFRTVFHRVGRKAVALYSQWKTIERRVSKGNFSHHWATPFSVSLFPLFLSLSLYLTLITYISIFVTLSILNYHWPNSTRVLLTTRATWRASTFSFRLHTIFAAESLDASADAPRCLPLANRGRSIYRRNWLFVRILHNSPQSSRV